MYVGKQWFSKRRLTIHVCISIVEQNPTNGSIFYAAVCRPTGGGFVFSFIKKNGDLYADSLITGKWEGTPASTGTSVVGALLSLIVASGKKKLSLMGPGGRIPFVYNRSQF